MPNKYEREIEEILRNMDRTDTRPGLGSRIRSFNRPRPRPQRPRGTWNFFLNASELFILLGIAMILLAVGIAYYYGAKQPTFFGDNPLSGWLGLAGFFLFVVGLAFGWRRSFRGGRVGTSGWRGNDFSNTTSTRSTPTREDNVVRLATRRRNPFSALVTQFRILRLKLRYQRMRERENSDSTGSES